MKNIGKPFAGKPHARFDEGWQPKGCSLLYPLIINEMAYTGRRLPAARAMAVGLVNEVFETQEIMRTAAQQMAEEIAQKPPVAIWGSKQAIHYARDHSTHDALEQMGWLQSGIWQSSNLMEVFMAKQQGRPTNYADLPELNAFADAPYELK